jgi:hypothetical protein
MKKMFDFLSMIDFSNSDQFSEKELEDRAILIGIVAEIILSKKLFRKNEELKDFISAKFNLDLLEYIYKSRTLLLARVIRLLESAGKEQLQDYIDKVTEFIIDYDKKTKMTFNESGVQRKNKKKNTLETIDSWRKVISRSHE